MKSAIPLRRRSAFWLLLPAVPLLVIVSQFSEPILVLSGWWPWTVGQSMLLILVPAAVASTGAALEAGRLRARGEENLTNIRNPISTVVVSIWPSVVAGIVAQLLAIGLVALTAWGGTSPVPWSLIGTLATILVFHASLGFVLGSALRPMFAVPLSIALSYMWLGFTGTLEMFEARHLAGLVLNGCCDYDQQPAAASMAAATVFSAIASIGLLIVASVFLRVARGGRFWVLGAGVVLVAIAASAGLTIAKGLGPSGVEQRSVDQLHCSPGEVTVCLFPEQEGGGIVATVQLMIERVTDTGVHFPSRIVASGELEPTEDVHPFRYRPDMDERQVAASLASGFMTEACDGEPASRTRARDAAQELATYWLEYTMLGSNSSEAEAYAESGLLALTALPDSEQAEWVNRALASTRDCAAKPPPLP